MIQLIQNWIWNIGGFLFSILLIIAILVTILSWIINRLSGWQKKDMRDKLFYWIKNKKRICEIIKKEEIKNEIKKIYISKED